MQPRIIDISRVYKTPPTEPIILATAKTHLRVDFTDDDVYITTLITQCRRAVENYCFISIVPYTITFTVDSCNGAFYPIGASYNTENLAYNKFTAPGSFELPYGPLPGGVTSVSTVNSDGTFTAQTATQYSLYGVDFKKILAYGNTNQIVYDTGYATVPEDLILAILNECAFRYDNRGDSTNRYAQQNVGLSESANYLAEPYRRLAWL